MHNTKIYFNLLLQVSNKLKTYEAEAQLNFWRILMSLIGGIHNNFKQSHKQLEISLAISSGKYVFKKDIWIKWLPFI